MITIFNTKPFLKSIDHLKSNLFPYKGKQDNDSAKIHFAKNYRRTSLKTQSRVESKPVNIEFHQQQSKIFDTCSIRKRVLTTSEKLYNRKRNQYSNYIRPNLEKRQNCKSVNKWFKIGARTINKIDFVANNQDKKEIKHMKTSLNFFKKAKNSIYSHVKTQSLLNETSTNEVMILKNQKTGKEDEIFKSLPPTFRKKIESKKQKRFKRVWSQKFKLKAKEVQYYQYIPIKKQQKKQPFTFGMTQKASIHPEKLKQKLVIYHDFLWKVNYSNGFYVSPTQEQTIYRAYIGPGNNSNLIKSILRRRFWWTIADKQEGCNFVWTQLKLNSIFKQQAKAQINKVASIYPNAVQSYLPQLHHFIPNHNYKFFNQIDSYNWSEHLNLHSNTETIINEKTYKGRLNFYLSKNIEKRSFNKIAIHNHLEQNYFLGNKKALFYHIKKFYQLQHLDAFQAIPLTFHITKGLDDANYKVFLRYYHQLEDLKIKENLGNVWIIKPGQCSNRGNGISMCYGLDDIKMRLNGRQKNSDGSLRSFILQKYIERPLLYKGRKFDIRHYILITCFNGIFKAFWYPEGYIRTSSTLFSLKKNTNLFTHLTNDAIQKHSRQYGKYEKGNKISYCQFQKYLNKQKYSKDIFLNNILPEMKKLATNAVKSAYLTLDPNRRQHNFQLLGLDFMIDQTMKPWLIQINTNPCLELSSPLLARLIPELIEQTFRLCVDPFFPPPDQWPNCKKMFFGQNIDQFLHFELIFDELIDGKQVQKILENNINIDKKAGKIQQDAEVFQNQGSVQLQEL